MSSTPVAENKAKAKTPDKGAPKLGHIKSKAKTAGPIWSDPIDADILDDKTEKARQRRIGRIVYLQTFAIAILAFALLAEMPFSQPIYQYFALTPDHQIMGLIPLYIPNMTKQAILSWATNSVTEIMTFGFGDYQSHLRAQRVRFTPEGWASFSGAFDKMGIGEAFRLRQLVLTTVPSNIGIITSQGENLEHVYEWHLDMPVIMTYTTNNNVTTHERKSISLVIARVPAGQSPAGIAIQSWRVH